MTESYWRGAGLSSSALAALCFWMSGSFGQFVAGSAVEETGGGKLRFGGTTSGERSL
jgi:hypothetical protein